MFVAITSGLFNAIVSQQTGLKYTRSLKQIGLKFSTKGIALQIM